MTSHPTPRLTGRRAAALLLVPVALALLPAAPASAHPLGSFTVNVHLGVTVQPDRLLIDRVVDLAELPTLQAGPLIDADGDGTRSDEERRRWATAGCRRWADEVVVRVDDQPGTLDVVEVVVAESDGGAGLPVLRVECAMGVDLAPLRDGAVLSVRDTTFPDRAGWREITAVGDGVEVDADVPQRSPSDRLRAYPEDAQADPLDVREARLVVQPGQAVPELGAGAVDGGGEGLLAAVTAGAERLVADRLGRGGVQGVALLAALVLGALHALAPGHGKAVVAAYLVGQRGSLRHATALATSVALTHTAGVLGLGAALWTASIIAPERLYPALGATSGAVIAGLGLLLLRRARQRDHVHSHDHAHHDHGRHDPVAPDGGGGPAGDDRVPLRVGSVLALGFAGGLVPTPSALLVLLAAATAGRVGLGVLLVGAYGVGMAVALVGFGWALAAGHRRFADRLDRVRIGRLHSLGHALPSITAGAVVLAGVGVIARSVLLI